MQFAQCRVRTAECSFLLDPHSNSTDRHCRPLKYVKWREISPSHGEVLNRRRVDCSQLDCTYSVFLDSRHSCDEQFFCTCSTLHDVQVFETGAQVQHFLFEWYVYVVVCLFVKPCANFCLTHIDFELNRPWTFRLAEKGMSRVHRGWRSSWVSARHRLCWAEPLSKRVYCQLQSSHSESGVSGLRRTIRKCWVRT